ncbi:hypothetical protein [Helicobacter sp. 13S00477-4]|uniref:hypothetical protein n=1 Tax=Helicobacter sp. 13S00477-4 TaxID=1905759 RepID=UPI000BA6DC3B|nr:hypothetical protein [Helicobacter sp. 13S00477-4]PAF51022.1 hypothetical protein BKH44_06400 [Helicobacter sp. 13S00477-4]
MKMILILVCFIGVVFGAGGIFIEPKIGIVPYQNFKAKNESETLINFFDYGVDIYSTVPKFGQVQIGLGAEIRRINPLLSDKKNVGLFFTLIKLPTFLDTMIVSRVGFLQNRTLERTFYYAIGFEKSIYRVIFQVLFDDMRIKRGVLDGHYHSIVLKMGIKI